MLGPETHKWLLGLLLMGLSMPASAAGQLRLATFEADITIPIGHRCMGVLPTKVRQIDDPLQALGVVLLGSELPVVIVALDWCEVRNEAYDLWREGLANAAGTTRERVLLCALHQHDAPVTDNAAQRWLDSVGLENELFDVEFQSTCIARTTAALTLAMNSPQQVTHIGIGQAEVSGVASNRRVVHPDGSIHFDRYSRSLPESLQATSDPGQIDPWLKSISFWNDQSQIAVISCYATHPMSSYGQGAVSADFVGLARRRRQAETPQTRQIYLTGCSGDLTAGKYNDGSLAARGVLADRLYQALRQASELTERHRVANFTFRNAPCTLPFHSGSEFTREALRQVLQDPQVNTEDRILAAMGLSSLDRHERGQPIDLPCLDLGVAQLAVLPGEVFVGYQLIAQQLQPEKFVVTAGYGECWTGYIPTEQAFAEGFNHGWRWVDPGCETILHQRLAEALGTANRD